MRQPKIFLLFCVLINFCDLISAQTKFTATITPVTIGTDETAELKLMVENAGAIQQLTPPALNNFNVVSGPNQESGMEINNGNSRKYAGITYLLKPKAKGDFIIGAATAIADGKKFQSNAVKIKVIDGTTGNGAGSSFPFTNLIPFEEPVTENNFNDFILKKGEDIPGKINKNIFIKAEADKTSCFVGEPVVVTYKLYTRLKSVSNIVKNPSFNGFSVIDLSQPNDNRYTVEKLNGRAYNVYTLRKAQLYPLQQGVMDLEAASVENDIRFVKEEYLDKNHPALDLYGDFIPSGLPPEAVVNEKVTLQNKPLLINVKALPEEKKPASFNGAVGNFDIRSEVEKNYFTTDDAGRLQITISGQGNLALVTGPEFEWPAGIEAFEPSVKEELNKLSVPVSGNRTFEYAFNISKAGSYTLPSIDYSFFDAAGKQYKTIRTKPITINVAKGSGKKPALPAIETGISQESFFETIFTQRWLIIVPVAVLILTGLFFWLRADDKKQQVVIAAGKTELKDTELPAPPSPRNHLANAEAILSSGSAHEFYTALNKELCDFLAERLQLMPEMMNKKNIAAGLDKAGIPVEMSIAIQEMMDEISLQLYTPFAEEHNRQFYYAKAIEAIQALEKTEV